MPGKWRPDYEAGQKEGESPAVFFWAIELLKIKETNLFLKFVPLIIRIDAYAGSWHQQRDEKHSERLLRPYLM